MLRRHEQREDVRHPGGAEVVPHRAGQHLHLRQGLLRLRMVQGGRRRGGLLRDKAQAERAAEGRRTAPLAERKAGRRRRRSGGTGAPERPRGVSRKTEARGVPRRGERPGFRLPDEQLQAGRRDNRRDLQEEMADRAVLQVDQAEPSDQDLPWDKRERSDDADMGRARALPAGRLHQVPGQGQDQPGGDHRQAPGAPDGEKQSAGTAFIGSKDACKASRLERTASAGAFWGVFYMKIFIGQH